MRDFNIAINYANIAAKEIEIKVESCSDFFDSSNHCHCKYQYDFIM